MTSKKAVSDAKMDRPERKCPVCKTPMSNDATASFCSDRCKLVDLKKWFDGDYAIPGLPATEGDEDFH